MVEATIQIETGHRTSRLYREQNNHGGIRCKDSYCSYSTKEEGLQHLRDLLHRYVDEFGFNLKAIRDRYCYQCGNEDLELFTQLFNKELERLKGER